MKKTKKAFRQLLNEEDLKHKDGNWKHNRYHQIKRLYGDYLYYQDRVMFDVFYEEWLKESN